MRVRGDKYANIPSDIGEKMISHWPTNLISSLILVDQYTVWFEWQFWLNLGTYWAVYRVEK